jgi:quinoprotein glucose dehydrogenase
MKRIVAAIVFLLFVCIAFAADTKSIEWPTYGHDAGGMRFSPLKQITPSNVARLQRAWVYHMRPSETTPFAGSSSTPLVVNGVMYAATPYGRVVALDPLTGKEIWAYSLPNGQPATRGIEYWPGDSKTPAQIVFGSREGNLFSINASTGKPNEAFGDRASSI